jgi:MoaA/NifB/PqqE/SkfB family radical SAM enzyme
MKINFQQILETHLTDHCNLGCKGCSHFSPLVRGEVFADIRVFQRDMSRLGELFDSIYEVRLMGGEPLLHPDVLSFCGIARQTFPKARIALFTNGIRLLAMDDRFWDACADLDILLKITWYPIELEMDRINKKAREKNVRIKIPNQIKSFFKHINISGDSDPESSFRNCRMMFKTPQLRDGRIYPCFFPAYVHIFNDYFHKSIDVSENDYINFLEHIDPNEILEFLSRPIPMCRWCLCRRPFVEWGLSNKKIHEWIGGESKHIPHLFRKLKYSAIHLYHDSKRRLNR